MRTRIVVFATLACAVGGLTLGMTQAQAAMHPHPGARFNPFLYFSRHSFGFPRIFYRYHPGPHWDLMHAQALHLTPAQVNEEKMLSMAMMRDTRRGMRILRGAYRRYREDARGPNPSIRTLVRDVRAIGSAQAYLAYEMIPFHLRGYRLLDPAQRALYRHLARANWKMMHHH